MTYNRDRTEYLLRQPKTEDVVNELITLNFGLLNKQLGKFFLYNDPDALSYGYEALYKAIMTFDPDRNHKFSTYATVCIYNRLGSYIRMIKTQETTLSYDEIENYCAAESADSYLMSQSATTALMDAVYSAMNSLSVDSHKAIVKLWIDSNFTMTQANIAKELGCSQPYVTQVIGRLRKEIKRKLEENDNE